MTELAFTEVDVEGRVFNEWEKVTMNNFTLGEIKLLIDIALQEKPTGNTWLDARYNEQIGIVGHTQPYYRLFYLIAQTLKPRLTVELGCWRGDSSAHFAVGNPDGQVVCVDIHKDNDVAGLASLNAAVAHLPNMHFYQKWISDAVEDVRQYGPIECIFFDGWHDFAHVNDDWNNYRPLLADKALCIFDDITTGYNFEGMLGFWDSLPGEKFLDSRVHPGIPMGFMIYDNVETNRETNQAIKPTSAKRSRPAKKS